MAVIRTNCWSTSLNWQTNTVRTKWFVVIVADFTHIHTHIHALTHTHTHAHTYTYIYPHIFKTKPSMHTAVFLPLHWAALNVSRTVTILQLHSCKISPIIFETPFLTFFCLEIKTFKKCLNRRRNFESIVNYWGPLQLINCVWSSYLIFVCLRNNWYVYCLLLIRCSLHCTSVFSYQGNSMFRIWPKPKHLVGVDRSR